MEHLFQLSDLKSVLIITIFKIFLCDQSLSFDCLFTSDSFFSYFCNPPDFIFFCLESPFFNFFKKSSFFQSPFLVLVGALFHWDGQLLIECLEIPDSVVSSFQLLFDVGVFVKEKLVFEFKVLSSAKSNSQLIEFISKLGVVSLKSSDLSDVEVKIIWSDGFRYNPFLDLGLDLVLVSWRRRHF